MIIPAGYGYASVDCVGARDRWREDIIDTMFKGEPEDVRAELSVIGAWAWALSRAADYFKTFENATVGKVGTIGHSRGGKIALWASVLDGRFSMTFPNDSGKGGVALWRCEVGESVADMCRRWPRWLNPKARAYINNEKSLPVDQHMLVAALAPRPVHVAVATDDPGSDPRGEFEALREGGVSYELLTGTGFGLLDWPEPEIPHIGLMSFHRRIGRHDLLPYDFSQFVTSANRMM